MCFAVSISPPFSFITLTPCVCRPRSGISLDPIRTICPDFDMVMSSASLSVSTCAPTSDPVLPVFSAALIPLPPRFCVLNEDTFVCLPNPFSLSVRRRADDLSSDRMTSALMTLSSPKRRIPRTPFAVRPDARTSPAENRIALAFRLTRIISSSFEQNIVFIS